MAEDSGFYVIAIVFGVVIMTVAVIAASSAKQQVSSSGGGGGSTGGISGVLVTTLGPGSGTFTLNPLTSLATIELWGGGGGGGSTPAFTGPGCAAAGGGAGGGYCKSTFTRAELTSSFAYTIGAGGAGGSAGSVGGDGNSTTVGSMVAARGIGGSTIAAVVAVGVTYAPSSVFGVASGGQINVYGGEGEAALAFNGNGSSLIYAKSGAGGNSGGNNGAVSLYETGNNSSPGGPSLSNGAGGSGAAASQTAAALTVTRPGGNGGPGAMIVTEYLS